MLFVLAVLGNRLLPLNCLPHTAFDSKLPFPLSHQEAGQEGFLYHSHVSMHWESPGRKKNRISVTSLIPESVSLRKEGGQR